MRKVFLTVALLSALGFAAYVGLGQAGQAAEHGAMSQGTEQMDHGMGMQHGQGMGMMPHGHGMGGMRGPAMGMMRSMMASPEMMGSMMSMHGEMMSLMGEMMQKYGAVDQMKPEDRQKMQSEMMDRMGEILTKHGAVLRERAKALGK